MTFKNLHKFSLENNFNPEYILKAYLIENEYHSLILNERDRIERLKLYNELYEKVHPLYNRNTVISENSISPKFKLRYNLFKKHLVNKDFLDIGCGGGYFLKYTSMLNNKSFKLYGVDANPPSTIEDNITFVKSSILDFNLNIQFDVILLSHVLEHVAPVDLSFFKDLIIRHLKPGGSLIIDMPHKNYGPWDVTRIIDGSNSGKTEPKGSHFFESTHEEIVEFLKPDFSNFISPLPFKYLRYLFPFLYFDSRINIFLEKNKTFNKLLKLVKFKGKVFIPMECTLIAKRNM